MRAREYSQAERVGEQIVRLIAMFAMHLMGSERGRLKLFSFDEGWRLLGDPAGRSLLASLQRMGRSELAVPIISTQLVTDTLIGERDSLENLIGATFVFGMRSEAEAARALALLGLDPEDRRAREILLELEAGRCLLRDHRGRSRRFRSTSSCRRCCGHSRRRPKARERRPAGAARSRAAASQPLLRVPCAALPRKPRCRPASRGRSQARRLTRCRRWRATRPPPRRRREPSSSGPPLTRAAGSAAGTGRKQKTPAEPRRRPKPTRW